MIVPLQTLFGPAVKDETRVHYQSFHNIFLYVTERCQLRCGHCYMGDRLERGLTLPYQRAARIISNCRRLGGEYITFLGGEPTLHPDLPRMIAHANSLGYSQVMVDSNGLSFDRLSRLPPAQIYYVTISLDGASAPTHELVRGEGTFETTITTIEALVQHGYRVRLNSTVFSFNLHEAAGVLSYADRVGVSLVNFHTFSEEGYGRGKADWALSKEEWVAFCDWLDAARDSYKTSIWYPPTWARPEKLARYAKEGFRGCLGCSLDRLSIFPDGRCYVCSVLFDETMHFATMTDDGLVLNRGANEIEMFLGSLFRSSSPLTTGCPAEALLGDGKRQTEGSQNLISVCRCWKSQHKV
jgi:MoaA/NifB/PqqE/SkfB family radical SAM enzyme